MIEITTIGFAGKSAEQFFNLLKTSQVRVITDTRLSNNNQLAGYSKGSDLAFFAKAIGGIAYEHRLDLAPNKEILAAYRDGKMTWAEYETEYLNLLDLRKIAQKVDIEALHGHCLLCSEHSPEHCHRRLLAEFFRHRRNDVAVRHLVE